MELSAQHHPERALSSLSDCRSALFLVQDAFPSAPRYPCSPSSKDAAEISGFLSKADSKKNDTVFSLAF